MPLPNGFTAIKDITNVDSLVSIIGVLVSYGEPKSTRGTDFSLDFTLQDDFSSGSIGDQSTISCRIFRPKDRFPKISGIGDVIIIRKFNVKDWQGHIECIGYKTVAMIVFPGAKIPSPSQRQPYQCGKQKLMCDSTGIGQPPTIAEQMAVIDLKAASTGVSEQLQQHATITASKLKSSRKLCLVKDLQFNTFYDVCVQIVHIYWHFGGGQVDMKVTDYTPNEHMHYFPDPEEGTTWNHLSDKGFKGPYGYLTLSVTLYESNAAWVQENAAVGDYVYLRNMHVRMSTAGRLEGVVHQDKDRPNQVDIRQLKSAPEIEAIDKRRQEYEKKRGVKTAFEVMQNPPSNPKAKTAKEKRQAKKEIQKAEKEAELQEIAEKQREWELQQSSINKNIRAAFPEMKLSTISEMLYNPHLEMRTPEKYNFYTLPFVNCRHRSRVRVVDVFPPEIELFTHSNKRWEWGFALLLEDANIPRGTVSEKLTVFVNNDMGQFLLKTQAVNLKGNHRVLKLLEEKLFILWGNLMELKTELRDRGSDLPLPPGDNRLQNKPFDACIEEYGAEVPVTKDTPFGYQRMHRLAQTTILD
ncbi:Telomere-binding alpha subunit central domain-containing protein [Pyrenophora tritici-repentis]|nr:Telomere-binding alpha subunit central domain-containing protein [Pyrenophora tritici-repentis]KAI0626838.1 Telomere-binding alpha subunit central domain-containing protein [Pyrenophora tritici-repentis]PZC97755.1 telomere-binding alpha subunit central domain-containing protein [Pyrenophora tritici-repentis]PZD32746.1 telomere-binding alpha subunit central domain-containing protein [Pyrenophora tritici-repentis]PZD38335.1 telomere-binding alpha subunit central domain-containing protein [Pyre